MVRKMFGEVTSRITYTRTFTCNTFCKIYRGGPTLFLSVHPLILAKCSQNRQTKIDKNYFLRSLKVPGCLLLMCVHLKWYVNHIGYDWECF